MLTVKPYEPKYKEDVRRVCLNTGPAKALSDKAEANFILSTFCDYYIEQEGKHCFVAVDENDKAQGYIFCAPSYSVYKKGFKEYIGRAGKSGFSKQVTAWGECFVTGLFRRHYPAHLHIDMNPGYQRMGAGTAMMNALIGHLRELGIPSVMLIVGANNEKGVNFYTKYGFHRCRRFGSELVMGLDIK